ncbi:MAG: cytochrome c [Paracoccaceae bacterium]|jgi:cytochrome c556|nr:cytochrome c [Paracoccaceae bacterium]MDP7186570.1 cytochrome c [Paracoccaceae bacterium]
MKFKLFVAVAGIATAAMLGNAVAQQSTNQAVNARISLMKLYAFNLGTLGAMAKGDMAYDADAASAAASNLAKLTSLNASAMWPMGTDNASDPGSRALPAIWQNFPDVGAKAAALSEAAAAMQSAAGQDLDALRAAMGPLGGACAACHKNYRAPAN